MTSQGLISKGRGWRDANNYNNLKSSIRWNLLRLIALKFSQQLLKVGIIRIFIFLQSYDCCQKYSPTINSFKKWKTWLKNTFNKNFQKNEKILQIRRKKLKQFPYKKTHHLENWLKIWKCIGETETIFRFYVDANLTSYI